MLPPVDPTVLSANPQFDTLYRDLCTNKLNPDGSSALDKKAQKERDVFATELQTARLEAAKRNLIRSELRGFVNGTGGLPDELQELVAITAVTLDGNVPEDDLDLVQEYIDALIENPTRIAAAIEHNLNRNATALSHTLPPTTKTTTSTKSPPNPTLTPLLLTSLTKSLTTQKSDLATARLDITHDSAQAHELYKQILTASVRLLEQTIHGSVSRASKAKAEYLATVAEGMAKKLGIQFQVLMGLVYSGDMLEELQERSVEMAQEERTLRRKIAGADEKLELYRQGRGMEGVADEYAEIMGEMARVRGEIGRLEEQRS